MYVTYDSTFKLRYDAPSPGNTPPPDLTKDHIMDEHMDVSDGEDQEPHLVFEQDKSSRTFFPRCWVTFGIVLNGLESPLFHVTFLFIQLKSYIRKRTPPPTERSPILPST